MEVNHNLKNANFVKIVEVGPRDGLQNENKIIPTSVKVDLINRLSDTGLSVIEATSFTSPKWIPQLADHQEVYQQIKKKSQVTYPVLVPNKMGMERALAVGVKEVAVFTSPSETFNRHNINCTVAESLEKIAEVMDLARSQQVKVRGYISCALGCPYEGQIDPRHVSMLAEKLISLGCDEISLGDTIGVGTPLSVKKLIQRVQGSLPLAKVAVHFHDTYGMALTNIYVALDLGIRIVDSSIAGLGGCPYAKGASGNVATEDVVYLMHQLGLKTGVDLDKLIVVGRFITNFLNKPTQSKASLAIGK